MTPTSEDRLAELATRHYLGEYQGRVARRLDELFSMPDGDLEHATVALLNACDHLGVDGSEVEEVVARLPEGDA